MLFKSNYLPHIIFIATTIIAALNYSISKILMPVYISPSAIILIRAITSVVFFFALYLFSEKEKIGKSNLLRLILASIMGIAANQLLFMEGLNKTTPINAALMMTSSPIFVIIISSIFLKEKISKLNLLGLLFAASGAISILLYSFKIAAHQVLIGDIYILLNAFCWAVFLILIKPIIMKYKTTTIMPLLFMIGTIGILPFAWNDLVSTNFNLFSSEAWYSLFFIIIFSSWFAYYFNIHALKFVHPSIAGVYIYLQPVLTSFFAVWLEKDQISLEKIIFSIIIIAGIYLVSIKPKNELRPK
ncbi:MAG: DMT family transporter [Cytophagales bacterium]|nr:MAG: DMT family transporter [Cytophagales bacterium]